VLIHGETGTGKELLAQAIHRLSPRGRNVMVKVNCAALPSGLVESELFGREKGAFTGALTRQIGRFEVADGSTLFLDEVGELPADVQVKLLRVLQEGEFERLGSPRTIKVNVRVIAATNRDLIEEVRKGRFREDLYYRLNVFPIRMPPLRERPEDIPLLVWTFLEDFSSRMGKKITQVPRATMEALQRQPWPGNVRELRNVIEHGAIVTTGDTLRVGMLGDAVPGAAPSQSLADAEREHIVRALEKTSWRIKGPKGAATVLGLNPATLYSRMKKLGIRLRSSS
jgi:transcriptional regulator with GAF, ATPase, and Fis domain